jgi:DMSO/TMAO reductase YedYZ molybdopterin-dependent catalytic subunit
LVYHRVISDRPPNTGVTVEGLTGESLSQQQMFVRCNFAVPFSPPTGFELVVPGRKSRFITTEQFRPFQEVHRDVVLECAGNGRTLMSPTPEGTEWALDGASPITISGYRLTDVLGRLPEDVVELVFTGADIGTVTPEGRVPYQFSISRELAESTVPVLVTHIGGEPLNIQHGAPIRLVVPGHYAMKSVKWLVRVEGVTTPFHGHFMQKYRYLGDSSQMNGTPVGEIAVRSVISSPRAGEPVPAGQVEIRGSAWSGASEIASVEVSFDGGENWHRADLVQRQTGGRWAPVRWAYTAEPEPGKLEIMARATDDSGASQPLEPRWNRNGYANNVIQRVEVQVVDS